MKKIILFILLMFIMTACNTYKPSNEIYSTYNEAVIKGLKSQGITTENIFIEKEVSGYKIVIFSAHNAMSALLIQDNIGWTYERIVPYYKATSKEKESFTTICVDVNLPNGETYSIATGSIYDENIREISTKKTKAIIKEINKNKLWVMILDKEDDVSDIKSYDVN